jgi:uncharacterized protein YbjT (DUF2867 family)
MAVPAPSISRIVLLGASGVIGKATVQAFQAHGAANRLTICTRDPTSACASGFASLGCNVQKAGFGDVDDLKPFLAGADALYLIAPGAEDRADLVQSGLDAAKAAGVRFVLVLSVPTAGMTRTVYGAQFTRIESAAKASGIPYAFLRLPLFTDNQMMQFDTIRTQGKFSSAIDPTVQLTTVCTADAGEAAYAILTNPTAHHNRTYTIAGPPYTKNDVAAAWSSALGRRVVYERLSYDDMEKALCDKGLPKWQVKGMLELWHLCDDGRYDFRENDFKKLTGRDAMSVQSWIECVKSQCMTNPGGTTTGACASCGTQGCVSCPGSTTMSTLKPTMGTGAGYTGGYTGTGYTGQSTFNRS